MSRPLAAHYLRQWGIEAPKPWTSKSGSLSPATLPFTRKFTLNPLHCQVVQASYISASSGCEPLLSASGPEARRPSPTAAIPHRRPLRLEGIEKEDEDGEAGNKRRVDGGERTEEGAIAMAAILHGITLILLAMGKKKIRRVVCLGASPRSLISRRTPLHPPGGRFPTEYRGAIESKPWNNHNPLPIPVGGTRDNR